MSQNKTTEPQQTMENTWDAIERFPLLYESYPMASCSPHPREPAHDVFVVAKWCCFLKK
jgi:hypothetical protein